MGIKGAGGSKGGVGRFFLGLLMMIVCGYLFFNAIMVTHHFRWGYALYSFGGVSLTTGMTLVPLIFGIGFIFYNSHNPIGWALSVASLAMITFGVISSIQFRMRHMSAFELIMMLVLMIGGVGLFLSSLRNFDDEGKPVS